MNNPKVVNNKPCAKTVVAFRSNSTELSIIAELYFRTEELAPINLVAVVDKSDSMSDDRIH